MKIHLALSFLPLMVSADTPLFFFGVVVSTDAEPDAEASFVN